MPKTRQRRTPARWALAVIAVAILVAAIDLGVFMLARGGTSAGDAQPASADAVAVIDPVGGRVLARVPVGHQPTVVRAGYGGVWVLNKGDATVTHIDARSQKVIATLKPDASANALAIGAGGIWFAGYPRGAVQAPRETSAFERIDPVSGAIDRSFMTKTGASVVAVGGGSLWSTGYLGGRVRGSARADATSGVVSKLDIGIYGDLVAADETAAYYVGSGSDRVARVSAKTGLLTDSMTLATNASLAAGKIAPNPTDVALGGGALWISETDGTLLRIDPHLDRIVASIPACRYALAVAYGEGGVWVACGDDTVVRVDPATGALGPPISVGRLPRGIAAGEGAVWVTLN
jgi:hypothetical protein